MRARYFGAVVVASLIALAIAGSATSSGSGPGLRKVSQYDLAQLSFEFEPLDASTGAAGISEQVAAARASDLLQLKGQPEVRRLLARIRPGEEKRSVWVVIFDGGNAIDVPWGPYSEEARPLKAPAYSGILLDDQTGDPLVAFRGGTQ
jgi:hypothetical protein